MNDISNLPAPLLDRIHANMITFSDYTNEQKHDIVRKITIPQLQKDFPNSKLDMTDNMIRYVLELPEISKTTGLRKINETFRKLYRRKTFDNLIYDKNEDIDREFVVRIVRT